MDLAYWKGALNFPAEVSLYESAQLATEAIVTPSPRIPET